MNRLLLLPLIFLFFCFTACSDEEIQTQTVELKNDAYSQAGSSQFVQASTIGQEAAVTLGPLDNSYSVSSIQFLFGGTGNNPAQRDIVLKLYSDNGSINPGNLLYSSMFTIAASNTVMQQLDIRDQNIEMTGGGSIRVAFEYVDATGFPSLAQEFDGTYLNNKNWIKDPDGTWHSNDGFGLNGNWVIRATVEEEI